MLSKTLVTPTPESESFQLQAPRMDTWPGNTAISQTRYGQKSGEGQGSKFPFSSPASGLPSVQVQGTWDGAHDRAGVINEELCSFSAATLSEIFLFAHGSLLSLSLDHHGEVFRASTWSPPTVSSAATLNLPSPRSASCT